MLPWIGANPNNTYATPLFHAAGNGHKEVVEILMDGGADPNKTIFNTIIKH